MSEVQVPVLEPRETEGQGVRMNGMSVELLEEDPRMRMIREMNDDDLGATRSWLGFLGGMLSVASDIVGYFEEDMDEGGDVERFLCRDGEDAVALRGDVRNALGILTSLRARAIDVGGMIDIVSMERMRGDGDGS